MEKPISLTNAKAPTSDTGIVIVGMSVRPPALQEQEHHQDDEHDRLDERDQRPRGSTRATTWVVLKAI